MQATEWGAKKKDHTPELILAQDQEIQQVMSWFSLQGPNGTAVQKLEILIRSAIFKSANSLVGQLLQHAADQIDADYVPKPGQVLKTRVMAGVKGIFGGFELTRDYYYHEGKKQGYYPADAALGLETGNTPALERLICLEGADETSYQKAETHLHETAGIQISARQIQRIVQKVGVQAQQWQQREVVPQECSKEKVPIMYVSADGTGLPMRPKELKDRQGKGPDGAAKTCQAYLGCVFTQHRVDEKGHPVRDWESTTYVSSMTNIHDFGPCLRREALRRGLGGAAKVVVLIDGAEGLENMGLDCFSGSIQIVDFYHAMEHGSKVLVALLGDKNHPDFKKRLRRWAKRLLRNGVKNLIKETLAECAGKSQAQAVEKELGYFIHNISRMQYGTFRSEGLFIGSGVIEAGCKTVIGSRCKQSGMFWGKPGAQNVMALRCIHSSRRLDDFWKYRLHSQINALPSISLTA